MPNEKWFAKPVIGHQLIWMYQQTSPVFSLTPSQAKELVEQLARSYYVIEGKPMFGPSADSDVVVHEEYMRS